MLSQLFSTTHNHLGIAYEDDLLEAKRILTEMVTAHPLILPDPPPTIRVLELADSSVNIHVRPWVRTDDYFGAMCDLKENMKIAFDENGITIPYPQMDMYQHVVHAAPAQELKR